MCMLCTPILQIKHGKHLSTIINCYHSTHAPTDGIAIGDVNTGRGGTITAVTSVTPMLIPAAAGNSSLA